MIYENQTLPYLRVDYKLSLSPQIQHTNHNKLVITKRLSQISMQLAVQSSKTKGIANKLALLVLRSWVSEDNFAEISRLQM